jgi:hypothetical protein
MRLSEIAVIWCNENGAKVDPFGIICALSAMKLLNETKAKDLMKEVKYARLDKGRKTGALDDQAL